MSIFSLPCLSPGSPVAHSCRLHASWPGSFLGASRASPILLSDPGITELHYCFCEFMRVFMSSFCEFWGSQLKSLHLRLGKGFTTHWAAPSSAPSFLNKSLSLSLTHSLQIVFWPPHEHYGTPRYTCSHMHTHTNYYHYYYQIRSKKYCPILLQEIYLERYVSRNAMNGKC